MPKPTTVYRFYDIDSRLLYVGLTSTAQSRWHHHERNKTWWPHVWSIDTAHFPTRESALQAEERAIRAERPIFNIQYNEENLGTRNDDSPYQQRHPLVMERISRSLEITGTAHLAEIHATPDQWEAVEDLVMGGWVDITNLTTGERFADSVIPYRQGRPRDRDEENW